MPKIKTHSGAKKRFKLSKNGKPIRAHAYKSHILNKKNRKRKRGLRQTTVADKTNVAQIKRLIPYK
ncbi:MAG: 50S ribosomal protein L35 [Ruminococcus sp.]|nr:50S ribosomal protein L35 [Ruminococcus sp.]